MQCRVVNKPYDIFGTWYNDQHLLSGDLHWLAHLVSTSFLWLNKASQEAESEHVPITQNLYRFYNRNASSIRAIMVANCLPNSEKVGGAEEQKRNYSDGRDCENVFEHGNPVSHRDINSIPGASKSSSGVMHFEAVQYESTSSNFDLANPIWYNAEYRKVESEKKDTAECSEEEASDMEEDDKNSDAESTDDEDNPKDQNDKYLIFTTGFKTYSPHQIGELLSSTFLCIF